MNTIQEKTSASAHQRSWRNTTWKSFTTLAATVIGVLLALIAMYYLDNLSKSVVLFAAAAIAFATCWKVKTSSDSMFVWPAPIFAWGYLGSSLVLATAGITGAKSAWVIFLILMAITVWMSLAHRNFERTAHSAVMAVVFTIGLLVSITSALPGDTVNTIALGEKIIPLSNATELNKQDAGTTPAGCDPKRFDAYDAPTGSNNFGPTQNITTIEPAVQRFHDKWNDCLYLASTKEFLIHGDNMDPAYAQQEAEKARKDPAHAKSIVAWLNDNIDEYKLVNAEHTPYDSMGMIPGANRETMPTLTKFDDQPELGWTLVVVMKKGKDQEEPVVRTFRIMCDIQPSVVEFKKVTPTKAPQPAAVKYVPMGTGNGGWTPTPSTTPPASTTTPPVTTTTTTPQKWCPGKPGVPEDSPECKPKDPETSEYPGGTLTPPVGTTTGPATPADTPEQPAGSTLPEAPEPEVTAPEATQPTIVEPPAPLPSTQAPTDGAGNVDPDAPAPAPAQLRTVAPAVPAPVQQQPAAAPAPAAPAPGQSDEAPTVAADKVEVPTVTADTVLQSSSTPLMSGSLGVGSIVFVVLILGGMIGWGLFSKRQADSRGTHIK